MSNIYISELIKKIDKKTREYDHLCCLLHTNGEYIKNKFLEILEEYGMDEADYENMFAALPTDKSVSDTIKSNGDMTYVMGKMYKNLMAKSHPDKHIHNDNEKKYDEDDFVNITRAYENMDMKKLLDYAIKYDCDIEEKNVLLILEKQYFFIKNKIKKIRSYVSYNILINDDDKSFRQYIFLYKENQKLEKENRELKEKYNKLKSNCDTLKETYDTLEETCDKLKEKMDLFIDEK